MAQDFLRSFRQLPPLLLGLIIIVLALIGYRLYDPPTDICDIQMESVKEQLVSGFYVDDRYGSFGKGIKDAFNFCLSSNSPGGCLDMFQRFNYFEKQIRTIPQECGGDEAIDSVRKALEKALRLFAQIGWGEEPPKSKYHTTAWLDVGDLGLYCRMKRQYQRFYGEDGWQGFVWSVIVSLPKAQELSKREQWDRSIFSYPCHGLY